MFISLNIDLFSVRCNLPDNSYQELFIESICKFNETIHYFALHSKTFSSDDAKNTTIENKQNIDHNNIRKWLLRLSWR